MNNDVDKVAAKSRKPAATRKIETPWGVAKVVEEAKVAQRAGERRFTTVFQLLETERGEQLVRFAYSTDGIVRRGTTTVRRRDLERMRVSIAPGSELASALGWSAGDA